VVSIVGSPCLAVTRAGTRRLCWWFASVASWYRPAWAKFSRLAPSTEASHQLVQLIVVNGAGRRGAWLSRRLASNRCEQRGRESRLPGGFVDVCAVVDGFGQSEQVGRGANVVREEGSGVARCGRKVTPCGQSIEYGQVYTESRDSGGV
jgi:hypothetical protein